MSLGLTPLSLSLRNYGGGSSAPATIAAPFASVNGPLTGPSAGPYESWSVEYGSQPTISANVAFTVSRQGYTAAAATTTYLDTMYVVKSTSAGGAVRQPYPNQASQSATTAALSDYIYSTDTPSGSVTNNSTFISPKPVANWATPARRLVGDSIGGDTVPVEVVAFHRNARGGKQVACVVFTITDGTTSIDVTVGTPEVSAYPGDLHPVIVYKLPSTDISALVTGTITVNAKVYPWIGAAASVADSSTGSALREFSPRYFYKNTTKFNTPDIMYVNASTGNDTTAQVNNSGSPAATIIGAINRMRTGSTGAPWNTATTRIVITADATYAVGSSASGASAGFAGGLLITRDTGSTTKAGVIIRYGAGSQPTLDGSLPAPVTTACIIFKDLSMLGSGGALNMVRGTTARLEVQLDQVACDNNSRTATWCNTSDYYLWGVTFTNAGNGGFNATVNGQHRIWRGVNMTPGGSNAVEAFLHLGNTMSTAGCSLAAANGQTHEGSIYAFNVYNKITNTTFLALNTAITNGAAVVQNVFEYCSATGGNSLAVSHDGQTNSTSGVIIHENTFAGFWSNGRTNLFYDDGATARTNVLQSVVGNIFTSINTKGDVFQTSGTRLGNWGFLYGVGCRANFSQYIDAGNGGLGTSFAQAYGGVDSLIGTSNATPQMATSNFTSYQATTSGPTVGAGGGTYSGTLATVKGIVTDAVLIADLAGTSRVVGADTAGAYVAP
mgnify:FL=1